MKFNPISVIVSAVVGIVSGNAIGDAVLDTLTSSVSAEATWQAVLIAHVVRLVSIVSIFLITYSFLGKLGLK